LEKKSKSALEKKDVALEVFFQPTEDGDYTFLPIEKGKKGQQSFVVYGRPGRKALLYAGEDTIVEADIQKHQMKLLNDGWEKIGEAAIEFDARSDEEKEVDDLFNRDAIRIEVGCNLLPLVDPGSGAPLMEITSTLRKEISRDTGVVLPGIRVQDNMTIPFNNYVIYVKETPVASAEVFLDRFLVMGPMDRLSEIKGWSAKDPVYGNPAKWIEKSEQENADRQGCMVMGPLNVLVTHLKESIMQGITSLLGLQDVKHLLDRLAETHPVVVEEFLTDRKKLRKIKKILHGLLEERVSIKDLVTIMETIGDYEDSLDRTEFVIEMTRMALARQICWSYLEVDGKITALALSRKLEEKLQNSLKETKYGFRLAITSQEADSIIKNLRTTLEDFKHPSVIFCDPPTRPYFRKLTERNFPGLGILSTAEIDRGIPIEVVGEVDLPSGVEQAKIPIPAEGPADEAKDRKAGGIFSFMKQ
jgi:flagellar biosynthesis protein FlhA